MEKTSVKTKVEWAESDLLTSRGFGAGGGYTQAMRYQILNSHRKSKKKYIEMGDHERSSYRLSNFTNIENMQYFLCNVILSVKVDVCPCA